MLLFLSVTKSILLGLPGFHFHIFNSESLQDFFRFCFLVLCSGNSLKTMHLDNFRALSYFPYLREDFSLFLDISCYEDCCFISFPPPHFEFTSQGKFLLYHLGQKLPLCFTGRYNFHYSLQDRILLVIYYLTGNEERQLHSFHFYSNSYTGQWPIFEFHQVFYSSFSICFCVHGKITAS